MPTLRYVPCDPSEHEPDTLRFPVEQVRRNRDEEDHQAQRHSTDRFTDRGQVPKVDTAGVLQAMDSVSRRIDDLATQLNCLGYFDDGDDDRPRAA